MIQQETTTAGDEATPGVSVSEPAIELQSLSFHYPGGPDVIRDISLTIEPGSVVGIVGPSGTGKSTLLSMIAGLNAPTAGRIIRRTSPDRHDVSFLFQKDTLLPWLSAERSVRQFTRFRSYGRRRAAKAPTFRRQEDRRRIDERVVELLEIAKLSENAKAYPYQLSGGMRRRLAFLTAVAPSPQLLLLDEPFSSVDEPTRVGIHQDVLKIIKSTNMTALLATHDLAEAITLCDRVIVLTSRPAAVASDHPIPFGSDRDVLKLRASAEYLDLYGLLWRDLSAQIAKG